MALKRVNGIFATIQGEGHNAGRAAVFVRFAGCNLRCPFCDTDFAAYREMSDADIVSAVCAFGPRFVVLTGGEPALQVGAELVGLLHGAGCEVAMETNGTRTPPEGIDWLTVSPKQPFVGGPGRLAVARCNELKCIFDGIAPVSDFGVEADYYYLQPCDVGGGPQSEPNRRVTEACIDYVLRHPQWRLSLQTHKLAGFK